MGSEAINFTRGVPANESFPIDEVVDAVTAALRARGPEILQYGPAAGFGPLREWLATWIGVRPEQVLTANGSLQLIEFLCLHLVKPGTVVFTESPTYDRTITMLRRYGATIVGIPLAPDGPDPAALGAPPAPARPHVRHPRLPEPARRHVLARQARAPDRARRATRVPPGRGRALPALALPGHTGAHAAESRARARSAHGVVHEAPRARGPHRLPRG